MNSPISSDIILVYMFRCKSNNPISAGTVFIRQNLTCKEDPALKMQSVAMKLPRIFQVPAKTKANFSRRKLVTVLELLHLKMEVTVSEPCDVIRVARWHDENFKFVQA